MEWVNAIVQGMLVGGLYALFAAGLSLIFGVMRLVNIAHGDLIVLAAYLAMVAVEITGLHPLASLIFVVPLMAAVGYGLQRGILNHTLGKDILPPLLVSFGLSVILQNGLLEVFTADSRKLDAGALETASFNAVAGIDIGFLPLLMFLSAAGIIAMPVAKLVFRLQGAYFAIGTWVVAEVFRLSFAQMPALGGGSGASLPVGVMKAMASSKALRESYIYWAALVLGAGSLGVVYLLLRSRIGLALTAIRDSEIASASLGVKIERVKFGVYVAVAAMTSMAGALIFLQKLRISPDAAFSVNDWTAFVIFIVVIGGIGTIEGPIIGTIVYFLLREFLADLGSIYLLILGGLAIFIMLVAPKGIWGYIAQRYGISLFPTGYRLHMKD